MEAFKIFATFSLVDLMSGPLGRIRAGMDDVGNRASSLSARFASLTTSMAPLALAGGAVLGAFGKCVATAAGFEDQMAKVGAISRASAADLQALEAKARELGATTQFTASEVAQGQQYLAMAGFSVEQNLAALPAVLNLAAATATDLGRAADISSDIMGAFGMKAEGMTRVADTLALTCAQANVDMELLGDTMKYVAPVAKKAGLSLEETAAMAGLLGDVGIKGSQAGTTMKAMLNKMAAPTSEATKLLQGFGIATKDSAGNLRSPIKVLGELGEKLKGMGSADQIAAMKKIVGEEAMAGFSELIEQAGGAGKLVDKLGNLLKGEGTAADMAARQNDTLAGDMRSMGSAFESVQITIGNIFIPILRKGTQAVTGIFRWFDKLAQNPVGKFFLKLVAALSTAVVAITAFSGVMWGLSALSGLISKVFLPLKAAIMGVSAPMLILIGVGTALYAAWKTDFGGIATVVSGWWKNIKLVVEGVIAVFSSLKGSTGEIRGELAKEIKAAGLVNLVTNLGKIIYRIREFFTGIWDGINFDAVTTVFAPAILKIRDLFDTVGNAIGKLFGGEVTSAASSARSLGETIGSVLTKALEGVATAITVVVNGIDSVISFFRMLAAIFTGDFSTACDMAGRIWQNFCDSLMAIADFFGIGDKIRSVVEGIKGFFANLDIVGGIQSAWDAVTNFLSSLNPLELIRNAFGGITDFFASFNFVDGISTAWQAVVDFLSGLSVTELITNAFAGLSEFFAGIDLVSGLQAAWANVMAFFDGLNLFDSGAKLLGTFIDGIKSMVGGLVDSVSGALAKVRSFLPFSDAHEGPLSTLTLSGSRMMTTLAEGVNQGKGALAASVSGALGQAGKEIAGFNESLNLPGVEAEKSQMPNLDDAASSLSGLAVAAPDIPKLAVDGFPELEAPELARQSDMAKVPTESNGLLDSLKSGISHATSMFTGILGDAGSMVSGFLGKLGVTDMPAKPSIEIPALNVPEMEAPAITIPEAPSVAPEDTVNDRGHREGEQKSGSQTITVTIGTVNLPDVQDAAGFMKSLQGLLQSEIGSLEGMA